MLGNKADSWGGGAYGSTLNNCTVISNSAGSMGGGVISCTLNNCTLTGNSATWQGSIGGGADNCAMKNCILYYNTASYSSPNYSGASSTGLSLAFCCTTPDPGGTSFDNAPMFVNLVGGNLRLRSNSPCINAGNNAYVTNSTDLDGNPRIVGGTVDIGAYEFQSPSSVLSYVWAKQHGLPTDGSADYADSDNDRMNNFKEWRCGTDPTNALSLLRLLTPEVRSQESGARMVTWESVTNRSYFLERGTNLDSRYWILDTGFSTVATNLAGQSGTTSYTDTNAVGSRLFYYRVGIQEP